MLHQVALLLRVTLASENGRDAQGNSPGRLPVALEGLEDLRSDTGASEQAPTSNYVVGDDRRQSLQGSPDLKLHGGGQLAQPIADDDVQLAAGRPTRGERCAGTPVEIPCRRRCGGTG